MSQSEKTNPYWETLQAHHKLALRVFLVVIVGCGVAAFSTQQYLASAVLALNPEASKSDNQNQKRNAAEIAWSALTERQLDAIIVQFYLAPGPGRSRGSDPVPDVRSKISIEEVGPEGNDPKQVRLSYTARRRPTAVNVANALAQSLTQAKIAMARPGAEASIAKDVEDSRAELQQLAASQDRRSAEQALAQDMEARRQLDVSIRKSSEALAALRLASTQVLLAASKARSPSAGKPGQTAAQNQITDLDPSRNEREITREEDQEQALQLRLKKAIQENNADADLQHKRLADADSFAKAYALEQQRYATLLKVQEAAASRRGLADTKGAPMFAVIENAKVATSIGFLSNPLYWILTFLGALVAAALSVFLAERVGLSTSKAVPLGGQ